VTSANEPGCPEPGDSPNGNGSVDRGDPHESTPEPAAGRISDARDVPPWQRGAARTPPPSHRTPPEPPAHHEPRSPGADVPLSRIITGTAAPGAAAQPAHAETPSHESESAPVRNDTPRTETYGSELPDLSGPIPRSAQRKPAPDRGPEGSTANGSSRSAGSEPWIQVSRRLRGPVRASMQIRRIDPWSTLKVSLLLSVALFFVWMIAVAFLYLVLGGMGVWSKLNSNVGDLLNNTSGSGELVSSGTIFGGATLIGLVNIVLLTAMATIGAFVYNLTTDLMGGIEVTLADRD